jgi:hypothetical protein
MIIKKENNRAEEIYELVETNDGFYWKIEIRPYAVKDIKKGITRPYQTRAAAMKAIGKKIIEMERDNDPGN